MLRYTVITVSCGFTVSLLLVVSAEFLIPSSNPTLSTPPAVAASRSRDVSKESTKLAASTASLSKRSITLPQAREHSAEVRNPSGTERQERETHQLQGYRADFLRQQSQRSAYTVSRELTEDRLQQFKQAAPDLLVELMLGDLAKPYFYEGVPVGLKLKLYGVHDLDMLGLQSEDVVTSIDGIPVDSANSFIEILMSSLGKEKLTLSLSRDEKLQRIEVYLPPSAISREL